MRGISIIGILVLLVSGAQAADAPRREAKPPQWSQEVLDVFFVDAREQLVGARPAAGSAKTNAAADASGSALPTEEASWSSLIDAETLTTEIKRVANGLSVAVSKPGQFSSEGYQQCRRDFSLLALLFRVVEEFDEQVRWQGDATAMRWHLEQAASLCEEANDQSYAVAKQAQILLTDFIRGQSPPEDSPREELQVDRSQLMLRMEISMEEIIDPSLASKKVFRRRGVELAHESQLLAVLAKVIVEEGYDYSDDDEFVDFARQLSEASTALTQATKEKDYEAARSAAGRATQSCSTCHEDFRG